LSVRLSVHLSPVALQNQPAARQAPAPKSGAACLRQVQRARYAPTSGTSQRVGASRGRVSDVTLVASAVTINALARILSEPPVNGATAQPAIFRGTSGRHTCRARGVATARRV